MIVGAGISGLLAAASLKRAGVNVCVLEKGRGLGGRMATRRGHGAVFDHGAQFFTVRDRQFYLWVESWMERGFVDPWYELPRRGVHYRAIPGMTSIAKRLVADFQLEVRREVHVEAASFENGRWSVAISDRENLSAAALILTAPVPQSLAILDAGDTQLPSADRIQLESIRFRRCIAALAILESPSALAENGGALKLRGQPVQWIADNQRKGVSPAVPCATIHSTHEFAEEHWDVDDAVRLPQLLAAAAPYLASEVVSCQGHRWGFSQPVGSFGSDVFFDGGRRLAIAGDGLAGGRVEGAAISGLAAARQLATAIDSPTNILS
jgi:renalase